jgi:hypothetical protein
LLQNKSLKKLYANKMICGYFLQTYKQCREPFSQMAMNRAFKVNKNSSLTILAMTTSSSSLNSTARASSVGISFLQ